MKIALAQVNPMVGDVQGNTAKIMEFAREAERQGASLAVFPEMAVCGYPPRDLLLKEHFIRAIVDCTQRIAHQTTDMPIVVGSVQPNPATEGKRLLNVAVVCHRGRIVATQAKTLLPNYDVFDEYRYFAPAAHAQPITLPVTGVRAGFCICEDLWNVDTPEGSRSYPADPVGDLARAGAELLINLSASPFWAGKQQARMRIFGEQAAAHGVPLVVVNQVGGNDELIFDGASTVFASDGTVLAQAKAFDEDLLIVDINPGRSNRLEPYPDEIESVYRALVLGTRDYADKCRFQEAVLGLSGGIDSAVTAAIAVAALGPDRIHAVAMPSRYNSPDSLRQAEILAENLGVGLRVIPIETARLSMEATLQPQFAGQPRDVTEENIQSRIRGNLLMALSNKFGWLVLTTGNKSELAVGYCTLYGDMCGGLAVLSDVPKTMVYRLAEFINRTAGVDWIPQRTITRPPSAELRDNQTDQDSLPPYEVLDRILQLYVEQEGSAEQIINQGFDPGTVREVIRKVDTNEHKRRQAAVGLKVTGRAFGTGRRLPIAAKFG